MLLVVWHHVVCEKPFYQSMIISECTLNRGIFIEMGLVISWFIISCFIYIIIAFKIV